MLMDTATVSALIMGAATQASPSSYCSRRRQHLVLLSLQNS